MADSCGMLRALFEGLCDLVAPRRCAACQLVILGGAPGFCAGCEPLIERLPVDPHAQSEDRAACGYGGPISDALHALKYRGDTTRCSALSGLLFEHVAPLRGRVDLVACIPLHARRLRERGFNQAALLAAPVARYLAAPFQARLLVRVRDIPHQVGAARSARLGMSRASLSVRRKLAGESVLVLDDVRTTGATLCAARAALLDAGAGAVYTLVVATTE